MEVQDISTLMRKLKALYDKSRDKSRWRVLHGVDHEYHNTFILGDEKLWQFKSEEVEPGKFVAVGMEICNSDEEIEKIMKNGSPVPFGMLTPLDKEIAIIMAGVKRYSSDSSNLLCREYFSNKQEALERKLKQQVERMMDNPIFRRKYTEHKDRVRRAYV